MTYSPGGDCTGLSAGGEFAVRRGSLSLSDTPPGEEDYIIIISLVEC